MQPVVQEYLKQWCNHSKHHGVPVDGFFSFSFSFDHVCLRTVYLWKNPFIGSLAGAQQNTYCVIGYGMGEVPLNHRPSLLSNLPWKAVAEWKREKLWELLEMISLYSNGLTWQWALSMSRVNIFQGLQKQQEYKFTVHHSLLNKAEGLTATM